MTGRRGKKWAASLRAAYRNGAVIVSEETGDPVRWKPVTRGTSLRPWVDSKGNRHDSRDCVPVLD